MNDDFKRPLGPNPKVKEAQPVENEPPVTMGAPAALVNGKKKYSKAFSFVSILFLLAILGAGVMTYFWYEAQNRLDTANNEVGRLQGDLATAVNQASNTSVSQGGKDLTAQSAIGSAATLYSKADLKMAAMTMDYAIQYLTDENTFARVELSSVDANDKTKKTPYQTLFFKNVAEDTSLTNENGQQWALIFAGSPGDEDRDFISTAFGVPDEVFTKTRIE